MRDMGNAPQCRPNEQFKATFCYVQAGALPVHENAFGADKWDNGGYCTRSMFGLQLHFVVVGALITSYCKQLHTTLKNKREDAAVVDLQVHSCLQRPLRFCILRLR